MKEEACHTDIIFLARCLVIFVNHNVIHSVGSVLLLIVIFNCFVTSEQNPLRWVIESSVYEAAEHGSFERNQLVRTNTEEFIMWKKLLVLWF